MARPHTVSAEQLASTFGMEVSMTKVLMTHRLHWLGQVGHYGVRESTKTVAVWRTTEDEIRSWHKEEVERCCNSKPADDRNIRRVVCDCTG